MQVISEQYIHNSLYNLVDIARINDLFDEKQISRQVELFITSNSVGGVIYGCSLMGQEKNIIVSLGGKSLVVDGQLSKIDSEKIMNKYNADRLNALNDMKYKNYILSSKYAGSTIYNIKNDNIEFSLAHKDREQEIYQNEIEFLKEFIDTLFSDEIIDINIGYNTIDGRVVFDGFFIESLDSNKRVKLENLVYYNHILVALIYNHNCIVKQDKVNKKLKME